jgi:hypothetical protein
MRNEKRYISETDFHNGKQFAKINQHIDTCLTLLEKLISYNTECRIKTLEKLQVENYIIDYRIDQFGYYENTLKSIYYSCYSLKHIYDISTFMNFRKIDNTIGDRLNNQRAYITFTAIVKLSSMFEYTRKVYEKNIEKEKGGSYFDKLRTKYPDKVDSLKLLNNFRNTIHSNGKWKPKNKTDKLTYKLREGEQEINPGDTFKYDHWKIYRIIKDCLELNMLMALDNEAERLRQTRLEINGQKLAVLKTDLTAEDWDKIFNESNQ